jgi:hypothetical protein
MKIIIKVVNIDNYMNFLCIVNLFVRLISCNIFVRLIKYTKIYDTNSEKYCKHIVM